MKKREPYFLAKFKGADNQLYSLTLENTIDWALFLYGVYSANAMTRSTKSS
jgi:hypothetical protein